MTVSGVDGRRSTGSWLRTSQCGAGRTIYSSTPTRPRRWRWTSNGTNHAYNLKSIEGVDVELVQTYTYLGLQLDDRLDWSANIDILHRKGHLYFLRRPGSVNICKKLIQMFYQSAVALVPFHTVVGWAGSSKKEDTARLGRLVRRGGSVVDPGRTTTPTTLCTAPSPGRRACSARDCCPSPAPLTDLETLWSPLAIRLFNNSQL